MRALRSAVLGHRAADAWAGDYPSHSPSHPRTHSPHLSPCSHSFLGGRAFREEFLEDLGDWIEEVVVGCGPCGELRYPSYVETNGWRFPVGVVLWVDG